MRLDRNINGVGKYCVVRMRDVAKHTGADAKRAKDALATLADLGVIDIGRPSDPDEFFVIRLRDRYAQRALVAYATDAGPSDPEYASDVMELAERAGRNSPFCKRPD